MAQRLKRANNPHGAEGTSRRPGRLHRPHDPRDTRNARQPHALVRRAAAEIATEPVFEEERVEVQEQLLGHRVAVTR